MSSSTLTVVHKFLRRELFDMSQRLFRAAPDSVATLRIAFDDLATQLREHAALEEARLIPLLRQEHPDIAEQIDQDHDQLEAMLDAIARDMATLDATSAESEANLYQVQLDWNRFVAMYLLHLDAEERTWFAPLRSQIPGVDRIAQSAAALGPQRGEEFLTKLWAVVTPTERLKIEKARTGHARRSVEDCVETNAA